MSIPSRVSRLIDWHKIRHSDALKEFENAPQQPLSIEYLVQLEENILRPLETKFGEVQISYGFTSLALKNYLQKHHPGQMAPELDQHAAAELNSKGKLICQRLGASCDIKVAGFEHKADEIAKYAINHLPFDRIYFYGTSNALHISVGPDNAEAVQLMKLSPKGYFVPFKRATGRAALYLFESG